MYQEEENTLSHKLLNSKIVPVALMVLNITFFFYIMPEPIAERFDIFFAIVGGVTTLILSFWTVSALTPELFDKFPIIFGLISISTLFVFGYYFILKTHNFSTNELAENGMLTEATVVSKSRIIGLKGNTAYSMKVGFTTEDKQYIKGKILLGQWEYDYVEKGMKVPIFYSSEHPNIARIAYRQWERKPKLHPDLLPR